MTRATSVIAAAAIVAGLGGCQSDVSFNAIKRDLTPELMTLSERPLDVEAHMAYAMDVNGRLFWEDLGRAWYMDHPSRLSPSEIISVSGKPR
jgi:hypothetical protein